MKKLLLILLVLSSNFGLSQSAIFYSGSNITLSGTVYVPLSGGGVSSSRESSVVSPIALNAPISNLFVSVSPSPGVGNSVTITLRDNFNNQSLSCTISGGSTSCSDLVHSFTPNAGDLLSWQIMPGGVPFLSVAIGAQVGYPGINSFSTTQTDVSNGVCGVGNGAVNSKYPNLTAAVNDSNCVTIEVAAKSGCYSEAWTTGLRVHGTLVIRFKGCANINQNGNNPLTLPGGTANDSFTLVSDFPISAHANGTNSGVTFSGYTGTTAAMSFGSPTSATLNITVRGVNILMSSAGVGAAAIDLINTASNVIEDINCTIIAANSVCVLLDGGGAGGFTKTTHILRGNFTGNVGANQSLIKGQNGAPDTYIQGGDYNVNGASGVCWAAASNSVEFHLQGANCDTAAQAITEVGNADRITGWYRVDAGVTALGTITSGTYQAFCENCTFNSPLLTDNGGNASHLTPDGLALNSTLWRLVCTGTTCSIVDVAGGHSPIVINTGGNMFLGTVGQFTIDNNGRIIPSSTQGIRGTTTNDNANAASIGEVISSTIATGSSVSLSTGTTSNVTSISLTAGDWDCTGAVDFTFGATTNYTNLVGGISTTSATLGGQDANFDFETPGAVPTATADSTFVVPVVRESLASTTTVFLVTQATFTVSTLKAYGTIRCRRMR